MAVVSVSPVASSKCFGGLDGFVEASSKGLPMASYGRNAVKIALRGPWGLVADAIDA